ncbi:ABC transporter ATP-binding protein [Streptacidiphilus cavernicola]|uniref:ABC transporter ATP-binding protein n=1 Tax=Streptacidiphilus cavernicola TaxID=3342716 RepID=A0ABV6W2M2_9ACTN
MLSARALVKHYGGTAALDGFSLDLAPGEIAGLIGHNGAGKSTFVEAVTGLTLPDSGTVAVGGLDALRAPRRARRLIGAAPQEIALYPSATAREQLRLFGALVGLRGAVLSKQITALGEELLLTEVLDRQTGLLSGGQRRRVQAATALIGDPPLLLLDEPTAGADPETRAALLDAVRTRAARGAAVLYTTHYLPELTDLDATLAVARAGRIIARGSRAELTRGLPGELRLRLGADSAPLPERFRARAAGSGGEIAGGSGGEIRISSTDAPADLAAVLAAGCTPSTVDIRRPDLDDLYRSLAATPSAPEASRAA